MSDSTTYSSQNTGLFIGAARIMAMQQAFHAKYASVHWKVKSVQEVKPGIILFEYDFAATTPAGENITSSGLEYVIVHADKIQHIEIRNKPEEARK